MIEQVSRLRHFVRVVKSSHESQEKVLASHDSLCERSSNWVKGLGVHILSVSMARTKQPESKHLESKQPESKRRGQVELADTNIPPSNPPFNEPYTDPRVYDVLHGPETKGEVRALQLLQMRLLSSAPLNPVWLEPACGSGRILRAVARQGVRGYGFDISRAMIAYANQCAKRLGPPAHHTHEIESAYRVRLGTPSRVAVARDANRAASSQTTPTITRPLFFPADMTDFDRTAPAALGAPLPPVDLAFNLINTIRHLTSDRAMRDHFAAIARVLKPQGVYLVGISLSSFGNEVETEDVWTGGRAGLRVTQAVQYIPATGRRGEAARAERVISHLTIINATAGSSEPVERHTDESYALRSYDLAQWNELVKSSALRIQGVFDSSGQTATAKEPGYFIFALRPA